MDRIVFLLPFIIIVLHVVEEFVWPGGFLAWHRSYRPALATSITPRFALIANAILLGAAFLLGWYGPDASRGLSLWLILAALLAGNAVLHLAGVLKLRRYSPGIVTGVLLYLPLCIWGYAHFLGNGNATWRFALVSFALGISYEFWSTALHRRMVTT
ncbi:MAG: HXXEE domain-containing protein [Rhodanobacteraceae bacterium]